jgi:predicted ATP-grasp superfamily ATP-dependent carboligase
MTRALTILGASVRAAAFSARAAGFAPVCADLFGDLDLQAVATVERVQRYPADFVDCLRRSPRAPWMYTGALENYRELVDELAAVRLLYGNRGTALAQARDPLFWSRALAEAGLPSPRAALSSVGLPQDGSWLRKPLCSANGRHIGIWSRQADHPPQDSAEREPVYYQQRMDGVPISAVFVAADGDAVILGVTRQLLGGDWRTALDGLRVNGDVILDAHRDNAANSTGTTPFRYTGSIGPVVLADEAFRNIAQVGRVFAKACGLVGLFGVDAILKSQDVWPVEINPRYTASIEVLESASALRTSARRSRRLLAIECHEAACLFRQIPAPLGQSDEVLAGKLVYYSSRDGNFTTAAARWAAEQNLDRVRPAVADIPAAGTPLRLGDPVLTLLADDVTASGVCSKLSRAAEELEAMLAAHG